MRLKMLKIGTVAIVTALGMTLAANTAIAQEPIKVGALQPLAGNCAQWGVPITRGIEMWADEFNSDGGIAIATGEKHPITVKAYDNVCYVPGDELKAARRAILDDKVDLILQTFTPAARQAVAELVTENKVLTTSYGAGYLNKKYPYLIGGLTGSPTSHMYIASHIVNSVPGAKRIAILTVDNSFGQAARAYYQAGLAPYMGNIEIVYDEAYAAGANSDMLGLLTPVMQSNPDVILEMGLTPGQKGALIETADQLGFKGVFGSEAWTLSFIKDRASTEQIAGRLFMAYALDASDPEFSPRAHEFYKRYLDKYGADEWSVFAAISYAAMTSFEPAIAKAKAPTGEAIREAMFASSTVDHPIFGESQWGGEELYGANNHLLTPLPVYRVNDKGAFVVSEVVDVAKWWEENKSVALPKLKAGGQVYTE